MKPRHGVFLVLLINVLAIGAFIWKWKSHSSTPQEFAVSGLVLSPDGSPAPGATVHVLVSPSNPREMVPPPPRGTTGPAGEFRIGPVQPYNYFLVATHPTLCDSVPLQILVDGRRRGTYVIHLTRGGRVTGTVRPSEGPVAGRQVILFGYKDQETRTDSTGSFAFEGVQAGDWGIFLDPVGGTDSRHFRQRVIVQDGETTVFDVKSNSSLPPVER